MSLCDPIVQKSAEDKLLVTPLSATNFTQEEIDYLAGQYLGSQNVVTTNNDLRIQRELVLGEERATTLTKRAQERCRNISRVLNEAEGLGRYHPPEPYGA